MRVAELCGMCSRGKRFKFALVRTCSGKKRICDSKTVVREAMDRERRQEERMI